MKKILFTFTILILSIIVNAAIYTSAGTGNFNLASTWVGGVVPPAGSDIVIEHEVTVAISPGISYLKLKLKQNGDFIVNAGVTITFNGALDFKSKDIDLSIYGTLNVEQISVDSNNNNIFVYGGGALNITNGLTLTGSSPDLLISNSGTVSVGGDVNINSPTGTVTVNGNLDVNGSFNNNGTIDVGSSGTLIVDGTLNNNGTIKNAGIIYADHINGPISGVVNPVLPIELLYFNAYFNLNYVTIEWSTASELNNNYFVIEYSINANDWNTLAAVNGAGNSSIQIDYIYEHITNKSYYYRLTQIDYDGNIVVFDIISSQVNNNVEQLDFEVFDVSGKYLGSYNKQSILNFNTGIYILRNSKQTLKIGIK